MESGLYINSLALQAVVDRWTTMSNESAQSHSQTQNGQPALGSSNSSNSWFQTLNELYRVNEHYIQEVIDSSRKILQTVLDGLVPEGRLRHAPIRTFFRILSGMIFILKVRSLAATSAGIILTSHRLSHWELEKTMCESP